MSSRTSHPLRFTRFGPFRRGRIRKRYLALIVLLLLIAWAGWTVYRAVTATPGPLVDYGKRLLDLGAQMQPEGENGWAAFIDATERFQNMGAPDRPDWPTDEDVLADIGGYTRVLQGEFDPHRVRFELALIEHAEQAGVLDALDAAASAPRALRGTLDGAGAGMLFLLLPEMGQARGLAKLSASRMRATLEAGDTEQFLRSAEHGLAVARITSHDPFLIGHLVGTAVASLIDTEIACAVVDKQLDEATCRRLLEMLDRHRVASRRRRSRWKQSVCPNLTSSNASSQMTVTATASCSRPNWPRLPTTWAADRRFRDLIRFSTSSVS